MKMLIAMLAVATMLPFAMIAGVTVYKAAMIATQIVAGV